MFKRKLKDVDLASRAQNLHALGYALYGGVVGGILGAVRGGILGFLVGWIVTAGIIYLITTVTASTIASGAANLYGGSGSSTPAKREYSRGDALNAHGKYDEAVVEYQRCAALYPQDPEPRMRLARMLRDRMDRPEDAALNFKQVLAFEEVDEGVWIQAARELSELYAHRLKQPQRALPTLAQLHARFPNSPAGQWARQELTEIKQSMRDAGG